MDPLKQQQISMATVDVFLAIEEQLLVNIAKQLKKHKSLLTEDNIFSWQTEQLYMLGSLTQQNVITIAKHSRLAVNEVTKALEKAGYGTIQEFEGELKEAVQLGLLIQPPNIGASTVLQDILLAYQMQALDMFNMVNTTLLNQSQQIYLDIVNQTVGKVLAGVQTPYVALRETARKWAEKGVPALIDKAGRYWSTEAYVNMVMRSTTNNVANEMQDQRMNEYGADLFEVSSYPGARPKCFHDQGKIYSMSGNHPKYPPISSTSYGDPDGLFGINCSHIKYVFIEGLSTQRNFPYEDIEKNRKIYVESQQQRKLERDIRKVKRELSMMEAMGDQDGIQEAKQKVKDKQANMRAFIEDTGRTRRRQREQIH